MAQFENNDFGHDTDAEHLIRINSCIRGLDKYEGEVELPADLVAELRDHHAKWFDIDQNLDHEIGEQLGWTAQARVYMKELRKLIVSGRYMVKSVAGASDSEDERGAIYDDFGVRGTLPLQRLKLIALAKKMVAANQRYIDAGNPYALPEGHFGKIADKAAELEDAIATQEKEKSERHHAAVTKRAERKRGNRLLSALFKWLCAIWGREDHRLLEFGFVSKSQIVTRKK